jgi:hypothetical protein
MFQNFKMQTLTWKNFFYNYDNNFESKWTPIEAIIKDIKVGKSQSFIKTKIQFSIQLVVVRDIHCSQGLLLDEFIFGSTNIKKIINSHIQHYLAFVQNKIIIFSFFSITINFLCGSRNTYRNEQIEKNYNLDTIRVWS